MLAPTSMVSIYLITLPPDSFRDFLGIITLAIFACEIRFRSRIYVVEPKVC